MRRDWPAAALSFAESVTTALRSLGGVELARAAEAKPATRGEVVAPALAQLGLLDLDPWGEEEESAAAMLGARAAGAAVLSWPIVPTLAVPVPLRSTVDGVYLVHGTPARLEHLDLFGRAITVDLDGGVRPVRAGSPHRAPLDPFAVTALADDARPTPTVDVEAVIAMHLVLDAFWVVGALASVGQRAVEHARDREQFGRSIGTFGEIRWRLADLAVAQDGLAELARHAWWLVRQGEATETDLLALRVATIEAAEVVLAGGHQILGAMGLCEEHDITVIDRTVQSVLHRPTGRLATTGRLARAIAAHGFDGIYPVPPRGQLG